MAGLVGFLLGVEKTHGKSQLHQITKSVGSAETYSGGVEGDEDSPTQGKGILVKYDSSSPILYNLDYEPTKSYTDPLIEYSFCFGDCYTIAGSESSYNRVGVNIFKGATAGDDTANGTLIHACGSIKDDGTIISSTGGYVEANGFGQSCGRNPSYSPVYMRFIYHGTINKSEIIRLKIAATDVVKVRIRDVLLTIKDTATTTQ
jgi:hypothetical protein